MKTLVLSSAMFVCTVAAAADAVPHADARMITAVGIGRPPAHPTSPAQGRLMAERAALLTALRHAARDAGRSVPPGSENAVGDGGIRVGATIADFRVTRVTRDADGSVRVEVTVPAGAVDPR